MKYIFTFFLLLTSAFSINYEISNTKIANGRTALISFEKNINIVYESIDLLGSKFLVFDNKVLIPISYYEKPKKLKAVLHYRDYGKNKTFVISLEVVDGKYKQEKISVQRSKVKLSKKDKRRAAVEYKEATDIYNGITPVSYVEKKYIMPLDSKITSAFGNARVYNGSLNGYHSGTDFRAKVGTPLISTNDGVVVLVKDRFYSGGSVIIDHGQGIYLCYYHMSRFDVKVGDRVKQGDIIGLSGVSGRVTGPHLHFSARVGGIQVDPLSLIELLNKNIQ